MTGRYRPARWLPGGDLMTVFAHVAGRPRGLRPRRERWELDDGDFLDVDRHGDGEAPTVVALHGLEGSSRSPYVRRLAAAAQARGLAVAALNFRGCSGSPNRLRRLYHSGDTTDLARAVARLAAERPGRALAVVGFSLGGNVAAKWFAEGGAGLPAEVRAGAVVSAPLDLSRCADAIDGGRGIGWIYRERFLRTLRAKAVARLARFPDLPWEAAAVRACRTFRRYDDLVTAPLHGFGGVEDYYRRASSGPLLGGVRRPLLVLAADDDPIVPADVWPAARRSASPAVAFEVHARGGHVGFVSGPPWRIRFHAEERAIAFVAAELRR
ncbi:MAG TPA: alpha/beta fold hydrolase [Anaeromyxobacteraceae bacterium]|nr:alpha/beta fold hydrolase [Anaeromyxobacteraceae bacterium]